MAGDEALKPLDVSNVPELLRIAEEVRQSNQPRLLRRDDEDLAVLIPVQRIKKGRRPRIWAMAGYDAFRSAAGGWKDVDTDRLIADIYTDRRMSDRPPVAL